MLHLERRLLLRQLFGYQTAKGICNISLDECLPEDMSCHNYLIKNPSISEGSTPVRNEGAIGKGNEVGSAFGIIVLGAGVEDDARGLSNVIVVISSESSTSKLGNRLFTSLE